MKKFILIIPIILLLACSSNEAQNGNETHAVNKDTELKEVKKYNVDPQNGEKTLVSTSYYENGNPVKVVADELTITLEDLDEKIVTVEKLYEYNADGNITKYTNSDSSDEPAYVATSVYDGKKRVKESTPNGKTTFAYDEQGELIGKKEFNAEGLLEKEEKMEIEYKDGLPAAIRTHVSRDGGEFQLQEERLLTYNDKGKAINEISRTPYSHFEYDFSYHANGEMKEKITKAFDGTEKIVESFDQSGKRTSSNIFRRKSDAEEFKLDYKNTWTYDEEGNLIAQQSIRGKQVIENVVYEYIY